TPRAADGQEARRRARSDRERGDRLGRWIRWTGLCRLLKIAHSRSPLFQTRPAMTDLPTSIEIHEEGPREGFQIEPGPIGSADKVRLIEALAQTGLRDIQVCSFVNPRLVPGWADADDVVRAATPKPGVDYTALWFNDKGLERALAFRDKLRLSGAISLTASDAFTRKNLHRSHAENVEAMRKQTALH